MCCQVGIAIHHIAPMPACMVRVIYAEAGPMLHDYLIRPGSMLVLVYGDVAATLRTADTLYSSVNTRFECFGMP